MSRRAAIRVTKEQAQYLYDLRDFLIVDFVRPGDRRDLERRILKGLSELGSNALFEFEKRAKGRARKKRAKDEEASR